MPKSFVEVHARVRPLGHDTTSYGLEEHGTTLQVPSRVANGGGNVNFEFRNVLGRAATQQQCFTATTLPLVESLLDGFNGTVLAYGQTGAGKSHTMFGPDEAATTYGTADRGLCARAMGAVFQLISRRGLRDRATVEISALECYNEQLYEMLLPPPPETAGPAKWDRGTGLTPAVATARRRGGSHVLNYFNSTKDASVSGANDQSMHANSAPSAGVAGSAAGVRGAELAVWEDADGLAHVRGLAKAQVRTEDEALEALEEAQANRTLAAHALNARSSRAHFVFTIYLTLAPAPPTPSKSGSPSSTSSPNGAANRNNSGTVRSKLHLVDLAGSERAERTAAKGLVLREAAFINKSLSALEQVVIALTSSSSNNSGSNGIVASSAATNPAATTALHVPYRRSKLTHLLKDSLGGNCRTTLVACVWPAVEHTDQTLATLQFAHRMGQVVTAPEVNRDQWKANNNGNNSSNYMGGGALAVEVARLKKLVAALQDELVMHDAVAAGVLQSSVTSAVAAVRHSAEDQSSSSCSSSGIANSSSSSSSSSPDNAGGSSSNNSSSNDDTHYESGAVVSAPLNAPLTTPVMRPPMQVSSSETLSEDGMTHTVELSDSDDEALRRAVGAFILGQASVPMLPSWQCTARALEVMRDVARVAAGAGDLSNDDGTGDDRSIAVQVDGSATKRREDGDAGSDRLAAAVAAVVGTAVTSGSGESGASNSPTDRAVGDTSNQKQRRGSDEASQWPELRPGSSPSLNTVKDTSSSGNVGDRSNRSNNNSSSSHSTPRPSSQDNTSTASAQRRRNQPFSSTPNPEKPVSANRSQRESPSQPQSPRRVAESPPGHEARGDDQDVWGMSDDAALAAQLQREDAEAHLARMRGDDDAAVAASPVAIGSSSSTATNRTRADDVSNDMKFDSQVLAEPEGEAAAVANQDGQGSQSHNEEVQVNTVLNLNTSPSASLPGNNNTSRVNTTSTPRQNLNERFNRPLSSARLRGRPSPSGTAAALGFETERAGECCENGERTSTPMKSASTDETPGSKTSVHLDSHTARGSSSGAPPGNTSTTSSNAEQLAAYLKAGGASAREAESQVRSTREALKEAKRKATSLATAVNQHKLRIDALQATQEQPLLPPPQPNDRSTSGKESSSIVNDLSENSSTTLLGTTVATTTTAVERDDDTQSATLRDALKSAKKEYRKTFAALEAAKGEVVAKSADQARATKAFAAGFEQWLNSKNTGAHPAGH